MWEYTHYDELYHYGVKGMRWGHRKVRKWATSKNQPSSAKSSFLAGIYSATGSKRVGAALDKSNQRDAENWKRSKLLYKEQQQKDQKLKKMAKIGASVAAVTLTAYGGYKINDFLNSASYTINGKSVSRKEFESTVREIAKSVRGVL